MDRARFRRVFDNWRGLDHQVEAVHWLHDRIPDDVAREFGSRFTPFVVNGGASAKGDPFMLLTLSDRWNDARTLRILNLDFYRAGKRVARIPAFSGAPNMQGIGSFREGDESIPLSNEPIPEGKWVLPGKPGAPHITLEWKGGMDNYHASWGPGIGPLWVSLEYAGPGRTRRSGMGIHLDDNAQWSPGSAGCVVFSTLRDLRFFVTQVRACGPRTLWVDWGRGTVPALSSLLGA
jgi:hypothetical protein